MLPGIYIVFHCFHISESPSQSALCRTFSNSLYIDTHRIYVANWSLCTHSQYIKDTLSTCARSQYSVWNRSFQGISKNCRHKCKTITKKIPLTHFLTIKCFKVFLKDLYLKRYGLLQERNFKIIWSCLSTGSLYTWCFRGEMAKCPWYDLFCYVKRPKSNWNIGRHGKIPWKIQ